MATNSPPPVSGKAAGIGLVVVAGVTALVANVIPGILASIYANEGGYVNHPSDPGGPTNHGVTEKVARKAGYKGDMREFRKHCSEQHAVCADLIYTRDYIEKPGFMPLVSIDPPVVNELVDTAVNMGPARPSKWFQQSLNELADAGLKVDGDVGPATVKAYRDYQARQVQSFRFVSPDMGKIVACVLMLDKLDAKQLAEYDRLVKVNPRLKTFYRGWTNHRIGNVSRERCGK